MNKTTIKDLKDHVGEELTLDGWVYNKRAIGKVWFLILRDGSGMAQCVVVKGEVADNIFDLENDLTQESSVSVTGTVKEEPRSVGGYEIGVTNLKVHQVADEYPITPKEHGTSFLMDNRHLWIRSKRQNAILKVRHQVIKACRDFFDNNGFTLVDTPIFTANACEGTSSLFAVDYFERSAYLSQSGQLYSEATAASLARSIVLVPLFGRRSPKHEDILRNSGWWSRKWHIITWMTIWN